MPSVQACPCPSRRRAHCWAKFAVGKPACRAARITCPCGRALARDGELTVCSTTSRRRTLAAACSTRALSAHEQCIATGLKSGGHKSVGEH
eukprot:3419771-Prymnesium_polylepis.1